MLADQIRIHVRFSGRDPLFHIDNEDIFGRSLIVYQYYGR